MTAKRAQEKMYERAIEYFEDRGINDAIDEHILDRIYFHVVDSEQEANELARVGRLLGYSSMTMQNPEKQGTYKVRLEW